MKPPSRRLPLAVAMTRCVMLAALVATPALAGCADDDGDRAMGSSPALLAAPIHSSVCADGPTTYGIDVSKWQGTINWSQVPNSGVKFAIIRVSDGTNTMDAQFAANWAGAKANGILRGAYQFFRPSQDAVAQANVLLNTIASDPGEIPPVIDVEVTSDQTPAVVAQKVGQWLQRVEEVLHVKPIIYTGGYFWDSNVASTAYAAYPLWTAHWGTSCPNTPNAWTRWAFHQFSATGSIAGISGDVDENRFNGDIDALKALAGPPPVNPACVEHGGADAAWCVDDTQLATCAAGAYSVGDCGAFGAKCSDGGGVGHCVHFACWTHLDGGEDGTFCVDADTLGSCADGQYTEVGCGGGWVCRLKGATAACVDPRCADLFAGGGDGHTCADADTIALCTGGAYSETPCGASRRCDAGTCVDDGPQPPVDTGPEADTATGPVDEAPGGDDAGADAVSGSDAIGGDGGVAGQPTIKTELHQTGGDDGCAGGGAGGGWAALFALALALAFATRERGANVTTENVTTETRRHGGGTEGEPQAARRAGLAGG